MIVMNEDLYSPNAPYFHIAEANASEATDFGWALANDSSVKAVVRFLRGKKMRTVHSLFDEFSAALQFPYYFGENWNAFSDCITDLDWLAGDSYILIVTDAEQVLIEEEPEQLESLINILQDAGDEWSVPVETTEAWSRESVGFHVVFQCTGRDKQEVIRRLQSVGASLREVQTNAESRQR